MHNRSRVSALIAVRLVVSTVLLGSAILIQLNRPGVFPVDPFFFLIGLTYALSVLYVATLRFVDTRPWLVDAQLGIDAAVVSAFIHVTGGIASNFSVLYLLPVMAAATTRARRGAVQVAVLSAILYLALVSAQYIQVGDWLVRWQSPHVVLPTLGFAQYTVAINLFGLFAVALLSGSLAEGLRSAGARLERASDAMADLRAFNQYVIDSLLSGLVTTDAAGRVLTFNRAASAITGLEQGEVFGRDVGGLLQLPAAFTATFATLSGTKSVRLDSRYRAGEGQEIELGVVVTTLAFPDGRRGYLLTFQDITDVRRLEREAQMQQRLAAVGEMAAGIAHEIRNPLASMSGSIQVLREELSLNRDQSQLMDIVLRESERLNDTIRSFLAYARPQRAEPAPLDVGQVVEDTARLLRNSLEIQQGHVVDVDVPPEPLWFSADENQIRQIVWNLATNGLRAMSEGGRLRLAARVENTASDRQVVLSIDDQGRGISAAQIDQIFQPFCSSFNKGTGLGLAIVHRIVTDHGGSIRVSSRVGRGTSVQVRLPLAPAVGAGRPPAGRPPQAVPA
jgi:two-component system sensor histidine kinase PilS (NtrC family)